MTLLATLILTKLVQTTMDSVRLASIVASLQEFMNPVRLYEAALNAPTFYYNWWVELYREAPHHVIIESMLAFFIIWLMFVRQTVDPSKAFKDQRITEAEIEENVREWEPEPLVPDETSRDTELAGRMSHIVKVDGNYVTLDSSPKKLLNLTSFDFLGMSQLVAVKEASKRALDHYGCGSCGPRGFYGTIDKHLDMEREIARFMGVEEAISYSDGASTVNSTIAAFAKKGDLLIVDDAVNESVRTGLTLSRAKVEYFKHNDMKHLETILKGIDRDDKKRSRDATQQRRFIVVEGLYRAVGDVCKLPEIMELKNKFCYRLMIDESLSFGAIGATGKGVTELFNVPITDVEIIMIAMDTALASVGGLCIGSREVVDHQRLSGAGYCFSAAAPPFLSAAAIAALVEMERNPGLFTTVSTLSEQFQRGIADKCPALETPSSTNSPIVHLRLKTSSSWEQEEASLMVIESELQARGVLVYVSRYHPNMVRMFKTRGTVRSSLRVHMHSRLSSKEIDLAVNAIRDACKKAKL
jgi:serine palmitoyltransferase